MKEFILKSFCSFLLVYVSIVVVVFIFQRSLMYFPQSGVADEVVKNIFPDIEIITVTTEDNLKLKAYLVPPKDKSKPILLAFHGNASLALHMIEPLNPIIKEGYGVLFAEYRGYGGNAGKPTEEGLYKDAGAYLDYIISTFPNNKIIAYGQSLGSAVAIDLVSRNQEKFSALILEVPFDSALSVANKAYPFIPFKNYLMRDKYESDKKILNITVPKLFLIAEQDEVVGKELGQILYEIASESKNIYVYKNARHSDLFKFGVATDIIDFLSQISKVAINQQKE